MENQGVTAVKRFTVKKGQDTINTNTILLTFDSVVPPKSLKIFYQIIPVDLYIPNPLRCFNCQKFGHHEDKCPVDPGSVCERCGMGNPTKCVNCGGAHLSRSNECETWKKEKEIMRLKITKNLTYLEARKQLEQKVQIGKDQEKAQSAKDSHSKNPRWEKNKLTIRYLYHENIS